MRAAQMILGLGFLGLMVACEPDPAGVEIDEMEVAALVRKFFVAMSGVELVVFLNHHGMT